MIYGSNIRHKTQPGIPYYSLFPPFKCYHQALHDDIYLMANILTLSLATEANLLAPTAKLLQP